MVSASLSVDPSPIERLTQTDRFGNQVTRLGFAGTTDRLHIESRFELETVAPAPLHDPGLPRLPWAPHPPEGVTDYLSGASLDAGVQDFTTALAEASDWVALPFLNRLCRTLFARMDRHIRATGAARTPAQTLALGSGACRDITVLFMAGCRGLGIATRFVSGYQAQADTPDGQRHLHAWPEVFLPGLGWRGYDPTHGIPVTDGHVALSAAPEQVDTMPVEGGFYGSGVTATLDYHVTIRSA